MSIDDYIRNYPGGAKALSHPSNHEGQRILAEARKKYWKDALQPSDPRFKHVYGDPEKKFREEQRKAVQKAQEEAQKEREKRKKT